jgi:hypothetical protein
VVHFRTVWLTGNVSKDLDHLPRQEPGRKHMKDAISRSQFQAIVWRRCQPIVLIYSHFIVVSEAPLKYPIAFFKPSIIFSTMFRNTKIITPCVCSLYSCLPCNWTALFDVFVMWIVDVALTLKERLR